MNFPAIFCLTLSVFLLGVAPQVRAVEADDEECALSEKDECAEALEAALLAQAKESRARCRQKIVDAYPPISWPVSALLLQEASVSPSFLVTIPVDSPFAEAQMKAVTWKSKSLAQAIAFLRLLQTGKVASVLVSSLRAGTLLLTIPQLNKQVVTTMKSPRITPLEVPRTRAKSPTEALFGEIDREVAEWEAYKAQRNRAQSARLQRAKEAVQKLKACRVDELAHFCTQCPILSLEQVQP